MARKTNDGSAYGKTAWSRHPLLVPSPRRFCWPDRVWQNLNPLATVTRRIRRRGERGISRKTIAQGVPDCSVCTCFSRVRSSHYLHTRPRVQNAPGIPCTLLFRGEADAKPGRNAPRERGMMPSPRRKRKAGEGLRFPGEEILSRQPQWRRSADRARGVRLLKRRLAKIAIPPLSLLPAMPTFAPSLSNDGDERRRVEETSMRQAEAQ